MKHNPPLVKLPVPLMAYLFAHRLDLVGQAWQEQKDFLIKDLEEVSPYVTYEKDVLGKLCGQTFHFYKHWKRVARDNSYPWEKKTHDERMHQIETSFALNDRTDKKRYFKHPHPTSFAVIPQRTMKKEGLWMAMRDPEENTDWIEISKDGLDISEAQTYLMCIHEYGHHQMRDYQGNSDDIFMRMMDSIIAEGNNKTINKKKCVLEEVIEKHWRKNYGTRRISSGHILQIVMNFAEEKDDALDFYDISPEEALMEALEWCSVSHICRAAFSMTSTEMSKRLLNDRSKNNAVCRQLHTYAEKHYGGVLKS